MVEELAVPDSEGRMARVTVDLQDDFALNQPLSTFALAALELLDHESLDYPLDVLSVIESTLDEPRQVLAAQLHRARGEAVAQMKADGIEYEERMELLQDITYPKPLEDLLEHAYDVYRKGHPWVGDHPLAPKSVARDLFERAMTFTEYVAHYELPRAEGLVLRYLASAYKALQQTVPEDSKSDELKDLISWLGELVRQVDSSLLDEWEQLQNPDAEQQGQAAASLGEAAPAPVTANQRAFRVLVRNALFRRVELASLRRYDQLGELDADAGWDAEAWEEAMAGYYTDHDELGTGPNARGPALLLVDEQPDRWLVRQIFDDPAGDHDWGISAEVDLTASAEQGQAVVLVTAVDRY